MSQRLVPFQILNKETKQLVVQPHFFIDAGSGILYYWRKFKGKRIKFSTRLESDKFVQAKRFANQEFERRIGKRKAFTKSLIMDELDAWLKVKESENLAQSGMYNIKQAHKDLKEYWGEMYPDDINRDSLVDWYKWFKANKDISMFNNIKYMRNFCRYLHTKVLDGKPLLPAIPPIKDPDQKKEEIARARKKERVFTPEEFKQIYQTAEDTEHGYAVLFMYTMATRIDETLKLNFSRTVLLDNDPPVYRWHAGQNKMSLEGVHALHPSLIEPLTALRKLNKAWGADLLFHQEKDVTKAIGTQQIDWKAWRERANLGWHWTPHTFRHTCLTNLFNDESLNQLMVCKLYRVSMKVAMKTYIKVQMTSILKLRDAVKVSL